MIQKFIDLTYTLHKDVPSWDGNCGFDLSIETDYKDCKGSDLFRTERINTRAGIGTHMDAPAHCFEGSTTIDKLELENLITECVVIKLSDVDEDYKVTIGDIEKFEKEYGEIKPNTFVIFHTGWSRYWDDKEKYRNNLKFPSIDEDTAKFLIERDVAGIGIDTLSPDAVGKTFPVHRVILSAGKYIVENVANADSLPPVGAKIYVMPLKIKEGTESPIRLVALI
jgi:kynurenine formamidase